MQHGGRTSRASVENRDQIVMIQRYSKRSCLRNQQIEISRWLEPGKSAGNRNQRDISMRRASSAKKILAISAKNLEIGWLAQKWRFLSQDLLLYGNHRTWRRARSRTFPRFSLTLTTCSAPHGHALYFTPMNDFCANRALIEPDN